MCIRDSATTAVAEPGSTLFERGNPNWFEVDQKYRSEERIEEPKPRVRPASGLNLAPMTDGRKRGLQRSAPSVHRVKAVPVQRLFTSGSSAARSRGSAVHRWFEQIAWLDDGVPSDDHFMNSLDDPAFAELDLDELLASFKDVLESLSLIHISEPTRPY